MPFIDLPFRLKQVGQIMSMFAASLLPKFMGALGDLLFQTHIFIHIEDWLGNFFSCRFFHKSRVGFLVECQKAKQSQPSPKKSA